MVARGNCTYCGESGVRYRIVESLCCPLETNRTLYINYTYIKEKIKIEWELLAHCTWPR